MRVEIHDEIPVKPKQLVVLTLTRDEATHLRRIIHSGQFFPNYWTNQVQADLWTKLGDLGIEMVKLNG